jgi:YidC/Oxa1 family membrane protein insertase
VTARACALLLCTALVQSAIADVDVATRGLELAFSPSGDLVRAHACHPSCDAPDALRQRLSGDQALVTLGLAGAAGAPERRRDGATTVLRFEAIDGAWAATWRIPDAGAALELELRGARQIAVRAGDAFTPRPAAGFGRFLERVRYLRLVDGEVETVELDEPAAAPFETRDWAGFRKRFWAVMARPSGPAELRFETAGTGPDAAFGLNLEGDGPRLVSWYLGPVERGALKAAGGGLEGIMYAALWFWLQWICIALGWLLDRIAGVVPSWGVAIMLLSLAVHVLMRPLSRIADRLQDQVQATEARLGPRIAEIRREFRGEEQAAKILALYKAERVHPLYSLKSLAGIAVVIPIFIGAFDMLAEHIELAGHAFWWIDDLSRPDAIATLPFTLPFFGNQLNLLPFAMTALSVAASAIHRPPALDAALHRRQVTRLVLMALAFFALFYTFPAGMVLYWTTNNLISVIRNGWRRHYTAGA